MNGPFEAAVNRIRGIVGEAHVLTSEEDIRSHSRDTSPWLRQCSAVIYPASAQEVAEVVKVAAEYRFAVWPFSKGKNWGYGATMGYRDSALILILERLNRIIEVNEELAYAVIEPGVTQKQLNDYLKEHRLKLWTDCTDSTPQGSVIGNALERGVGYTPYWDHFGHLCGMEVVLANGDMIRTGAGPKNGLTWNTYKWGTGPYLEGLFSQSNFGIVTRAGIWLMPEPRDFNCFILELEDENDQPAVMDSLRRLALGRLINSNIHMVNDILFLSTMTQYPYQLLHGQTYLSKEARAGLQKRFKIAPWTVTGGIYGTPEQVQMGRRTLQKEWRRFGRLTFLNDRRLAVLQRVMKLWERAQDFPLLPSVFRLVTRSSLEKAQVIPNVYPILKGIPGEYIVGFAYFKCRKERPTANVDPARDGAGLMWLAVLSPMTGSHTKHLLELCEPVCHKHGFDLSTTFIMVNPRSVLSLIEIFYDKQSPEESTRARTLYDELAEATISAGFQQYRTSVAYSDRILQAAPEFQRLADAMKSAVDPLNTIAPGRYGIGLT